MNAGAVPLREAQITRHTLETRISVAVNLDGNGRARLHSGVPFFDHMLDQIARHGALDLDVEASGDLHIDAHHTVEDIGIPLGQAFKAAAGDKNVNIAGGADTVQQYIRARLLDELEIHLAPLLFGEGIRDAGFTTAVVGGMGGSSGLEPVASTSAS